MRPDDYRYLTVEVADHVARVTLGDGSGCNVYGADALADFARLPGDLAAADDVHVALLAAEGAAFSLGLDPDAYPAPAAGAGRARFDAARASLRAWVDLDKPVVVALNGAVQGAPLTTVLLADVVVAEEHVRLRDFHVPAGLVAATGALLWPPSVGLLQAKRYVLEGEWLAAPDALRIGLVTEVVPRGEGPRRAMEHARRMASMPQGALRQSKRALNQWLRAAVGTVFEPALSMELLGWDAEPDAPERRRRLTDEAVDVALRAAGERPPEG